MIELESRLGAIEQPSAGPDRPLIQRHLDGLLMLFAACLVFLMQPGFMCLEAGLTRSKNSIHVAMKNLVDFCLSIFLFWGLGYGLMFGNSLAGFAGNR